MCFGEILLRLSPQLNKKWIQEATMPVFIGGAELNAATALARWDVPVSYCTAMPDNYLSKEMEETLQEKNIATDAILYAGNRIGQYYLPQGADLKAAGVIYDRAASSFAELQPGQIDWDAALENISWFHFSAISPALNSNVASVCLEAVKAASAKGIQVSVDLNYRAKLWQWGTQPIDVMPQLAAHCNLIMGNIWAAEQMLGIAIDEEFKREKAGCLNQARKTSETILKKFPKCTQVANTFRFDANDEITYYATLFKDGQLFHSKEHHTNYVVDKVGSGDTFMAGLIYGNHHRLSAQDTIDYAAAAAFNKLFIKGDATTTSAEEIKKLY